MPQPLLAFLTTGAIFLAIDFAWLAIMSGRFYRPQMGALMREKIAMAPSIAFYFIYAVVLTALVVLPALAARNPAQAALHGAMIGLVSYATYNLTNAAVLKGWPTLLTFVDLAWGTFVTGLAAWLAVLALTAMGAGR